MLACWLLQNKFMKNNFDISIPSIPSKTIKFKIQDIKSTAFGTQRNRFHENKAFLTKKFIDSFANFKEKHQETTETQPESNHQSRITSNLTQRPHNQEYRVFIPEEKKHMLHHLDKYKDYQPPILKETKYNRGYSFYKTDISLLENHKRDHSVSTVQNNGVSDNFFFPSTKERIIKEHKSKSDAPSCVFKNETRARAYLKLEAQANKIGPGYYKFEEEKKQVKRIVKKEQDTGIDFKRLTKIITNIVGNEEQIISDQDKGKEKEAKLDYMFIQDDRDRFGQQKYPIVARVSVPGPGAYEIKNSIQNIAQKVIVVQEQRKLLKEWFNS